MDTIHYVLFSIVIFSHSYLSFYLTGRIFVKRPLYPILMPLFSLFNTAAFIFLFYISDGLFHIQYSVVSVIFLVQILFLCRGHVIGLFTAGFAILLHFFAIRAITVSIFSFALDTSTGNILLDTSTFLLSTFIVFFAHIIILSLFILLVPLKYLKIITKNSELVTFLFVFAAILCLLIIFDGALLYIKIKIFELTLLQLILPSTLLVFFYIALFMMFNIIVLHGYKDKTSLLESSIKKDKVLKDALFSLTEIFIEVNCTQNEIKQIFIKGNEINSSEFGTYSNFLHITSEKFMHPEDSHKTESISPFSLVNLSNENKREVTYHYRSLQIMAKDTFEETMTIADSYLWYKLQAKTQIDPVSKDVIAIITVDEIHEEKETEISLRNEATFDSLTGALNKRHGTQLISDKINDGATGALFMIDIDNFKQVNDQFGHTAGDTILKKVSEAISSQFRSNDSFVRIGGDEFIVFLPSEISSARIAEKAQALCYEISNSRFLPENPDFTVTISLGIAICPKNGKTYSDLFDAADLAMYSTKNKGKNTYTISSTTKQETFFE